jgi:hypothetical protein
VIQTSGKCDRESKHDDDDDQSASGCRDESVGTALAADAENRRPVFRVDATGTRASTRRKNLRERESFQLWRTLMAPTFKRTDGHKTRILTPDEELRLLQAASVEHAIILCGPDALMRLGSIVNLARAQDHGRSQSSLRPSAAFVKTKA